MVKRSWTEVMYQAHANRFAFTEDIKIRLSGGVQSIHVKDLTMTACVKTGEELIYVIRGGLIHCNKMRLQVVFHWNIC
jgi:hypothetical protein